MNTTDYILERLDETETPGQRLTRSESWYRSARHRQENLSELGQPNIYPATKFRDDLQAARGALQQRTADLEAFASPKPKTVVQERLVAPAAALVPVLPTDRQLVALVDEDTTEPSGTLGLDDTGDPSTDAAARTFSVTYTRTRQKLVRWAVGADVREDVLDDDTATARFIDRVAQDVVQRNLENDILNGDGSTTDDRKRLSGILTDNNRLTYTRDSANGEDRVSALAQGVQQIQDAGHTGVALTAVAQPATLRALRTATDDQGGFLAKALGDVVPDIRRYVASVFMPAGTVLIGDFTGSTALHLRDGWNLRWSRSHSKRFLRGWVTAKLGSEVWFELERPSAFCEIADMG